MKYLQVNKDNIITDCISFPYGDYIEFNGEVPQSVMGGWYKLESGVVVEYPELKPKSESDEMQSIKEQLISAQQAIDFLLMGGM